MRHQHSIWIGILFLLTAAITGCGNGSSVQSAGGGSDRSLQGGATTVFDRSSAAYTFPSTNLNAIDTALHDLGDEQFEVTFVPDAPVAGGLGPVYNNTSCVACHVGNGRGAAAIGSSTLGSQLLVRISVPGGTPLVPGGPGEVPGLGTQLQDHAITSSLPEADVSITWTENPGQFADGTPFSLRSPTLTITPTGAPLPVDVETSLRLPPPVFGAGLLEALPEELIESLADPSDADGDGISGRTNHVWDPVSQSVQLGRFGRKANTANLLAQAAAAYAEDMGISNPVEPGSDLVPDLDGLTLEATAFYTQSLAVPFAVGLFNESVLRGEVLFTQMQCASCHVSNLMTGPSEISGSVAFQRIFPYTDLLVHDMGPGLADNRADFEASGSEWKTPALWGIGAANAVLGTQATYLHDGRARNLEEAILWHGGEAAQAQQQFIDLPEEDREALLDFLRSL